MFQTVTDDLDDESTAVGTDDAGGTIGVRYKYASFGETATGIEFAREPVGCDDLCVNPPDTCPSPDLCVQDPEPLVDDPSGLTSMSVRYELHRVWKPPRTDADGPPEQPDSGYRVYISPGHFSDLRNDFPCDAGPDTSEWQEAWKTGRRLRNKLLDRKHWVLMPIKSKDVGHPPDWYDDRIDTAYDWWDRQSNKNESKFVYITIHSNAGGRCGDEPRGTTVFWHGGSDESIARKVFNKLRVHTPGGSWEDEGFDYWGRYCREDNPNVRPNELCVPKAREMPVAYTEVEWHDSTKGARWIANNNVLTAQAMVEAIHCYFMGLEC